MIITIILPNGETRNYPLKDIGVVLNTEAHIVIQGESINGEVVQLHATKAELEAQAETVSSALDAQARVA